MGGPWVYFEFGTVQIEGHALGGQRPLGHGPAVYHLSESAHPHVVCERCGVVIEVDRKAFDALAHQLRTKHDFVLHPGHFAVTGRCRECAAE